MRETVRDGEPALAVDTEEEFDRALGSGVYGVPPSWVVHRTTFVEPSDVRNQRPAQHGAHFVIPCN